MEYKKIKEPSSGNGLKEETLSSQGAPCAVCGSSDVKMHHERPLQDIAKSVKAVNLRRHAIIRKQIPLCRKHHLDIRETDQTLEINR